MQHGLHAGAAAMRTPQQDVLTHPVHHRGDIYRQIRHETGKTLVCMVACALACDTTEGDGRQYLVISSGVGVLACGAKLRPMRPDMSNAATRAAPTEHTRHARRPSIRAG